LEGIEMKQFAVLEFLLLFIVFSYHLCGHTIFINVQTDDSKHAANCTCSVIKFELSSMEMIYLHPESVLADVDSFWKNDRAYWFTSLWMKNVGYDYPPMGWQQYIEKLSQVPVNQRDTVRVVRLGRDCAKLRDSLFNDVVTHICSFLPDSVTDLSTVVYLTALVVPHAFQMNHNVVLNANAIKTAAEAWNTIIHEVFHVGYYRNECYRTEMLFHNEEKHDLIYSLQNEGMATYVAFTAPAAMYYDQKDYRMLKDDSEVEKAIAKMNELIKMVDSTSPDEFRKKMFTLGVEERVLYICGAHIARTIDEKIGRDALVKTVSAGPRTFIAVYNNLVSEKHRVKELPIEDPITDFQQMRQAAVDGMYPHLRKILKNLRENATLKNPVGHPLEMTGQLLLERERLNLAKEVFEIYEKLFPKHGNPYEGLAETYIRKGDSLKAIEYFKKLIEVVPSHARAREELKKLNVSVD
jgi:tetratricopeptide (TPR) repeat protein